MSAVVFSLTSTIYKVDHICYILGYTYSIVLISFIHICMYLLLVQSLWTALPLGDTHCLHSKNLNLVSHIIPLLSLTSQLVFPQLSFQDAHSSHLKVQCWQRGISCCNCSQSMSMCIKSIHLLYSKSQY